MKRKPDLQKLIRNFAIEMVVYGILLVIYFFAVLQFLGGMLHNLYENNTTWYAVVGLSLIVAQAVVLEAITSYLIRLLRLDRFD
jgi:magnesium-transporting ATPase (P-type)